MKEIKTIPFTKREIKAYLDTCIEYWRAKEENFDVATYYIDAFQSVRMTLFGNIKK